MSVPRFTAEDFEGDFDPEQFVAKITRAALASSRSSQGQERFDPTALQRTFNVTIDQLKELEEDVSARTSKLVRQCRVADEEHKLALDKLSGNLDETFDSFVQLDSRISNIGNSAVRIGDRLEHFDRQRMRAIEADELLKFYTEFSKGDESDLSSVFTDRSRIEEATVLIQKLHTFVVQLRQGGAASQHLEALTLIEKYVNILQNALLDKFMSASERKDTKEMYKCATILMGFNNGKDCLQRYVASHHMFSDELSLARDRRRIETAERSDRSEPFRLLCSELVESVRDEYALMKEVFPKPEESLSLFLSWIFNQRIQLYLDGILEAEQKTSTLAYLQTLVKLYQSSCELVTHLKDFPTGTLSLDKLCHDLFAVHKQRYADNETQSLESLYADEFEHATSEELSLELVMNLVKNNQDAVARCNALCSEHERANTGTRLFRVLMKQLERCTYAGLDASLQRLHLAEERMKVEEPTFSLYDTVQVVSELAGLVEHHFHTYLLPDPPAFMSVYAAAAGEMHEVLRAIELKVRAGLEQCLYATSIYAQRILDREQKKTDFRPNEKADDIEFNMECTDACRMFVRFVSAQFKAISACLDGKNQDRFLQALADRLLGTLHTHVKKFTYNSMGALSLMRDLNKYEDLFHPLKLTKINERLDTLKQIANLYIMPPQNLKAFVEESKLKELHQDELLSLVSLRADFKSAHIARLFEGAASGAM